MSDESVLKELVGEKKRKKQRENARGKKPFRKSPWQTVQQFLFPAAVVIFLIILLVQHQRMTQLEAESEELVKKLEEVWAENQFYKKAYELTLDDIQKISRSYGGEVAYEKLAADLRQKELERTIGVQNETEIYQIRNPQIWQEYQEKGVVDTSCLAHTIVDTIQDETLITLSLLGTKTNASVYIDGNFLEEISVEGPTFESLSVVIPRGGREVDIVTRTGGLTVRNMTFDTVSVPAEDLTADAGVAWQVFDCVNATNSSSIAVPGAIRVIIQKSCYYREVTTFLSSRFIRKKRRISAVFSAFGGKKTKPLKSNWRCSCGIRGRLGERSILGETMGENPQIRSVCIVLPTYNEAGNIQAHLDRIFAEQEKHRDQGVTLHVLVVDDNSPDGTADIIRSYNNPNVHLLLRKRKEGLGRAYIAGIRHAIKMLDPDVIFEMDADGQHEATDIYRLLAALEGVDMVIGSRYVSGGHISKDWGTHRKFTSTCARVITRVMLRLGNIQDCSGGFRAIRTDILKEIDFNSLHVRGYAFQAVLLEEILHHGGIVKEIPITFNGRGEGESKMRLNDMIEGGTICVRIRAKRILSRKKRTVRRPFLPAPE